ncbi:MAG: hypothetical protein ABIY38_07915 [Rhodococcus sp. (in: high G+C Gram-positive bacteria)]
MTRNSAANTDNLEEATATTRRNLTFDGVEIGEPQEVSAVPSKSRSHIPEDHPLVLAFGRSYDTGVALQVPTADPEGVAALLRKLANARGQGVRVVVGEDSVTFQARDRRTRKTAEDAAE